MAFDQLNEYGVGDSNLTTMMETIDGSYIGKADITLSEYDTGAAPVVKVGSIFDNNGTLYRVITADETPTGYVGLPSDAKFYLYFDASATGFIYSGTVPTWNDALQGWYNGNDRALFSMYKDTAASPAQPYANKVQLKQKGNLGYSTIDNTPLLTKIIQIGDWNMDTTLGVTIAHGLANFLNIRKISVMIIQDGSGNIEDFNAFIATSGGRRRISATSANIVLERDTGGVFDDPLYDATSFNRGFITIYYEV
jgi:hypothetical protein